MNSNKLCNFSSRFQAFLETNFKTNKANGFFLIESVVILSLIGLLIISSVPIYNRYEEQAKLSDYREFAGEVRVAHKAILEELNEQSEWGCMYLNNQGNQTLDTCSGEARLRGFKLNRFLGLKELATRKNYLFQVQIATANTNTEGAYTIAYFTLIESLNGTRYSWWHMEPFGSNSTVVPLECETTSSSSYTGTVCS